MPRPLALGCVASALMGAFLALSSEPPVPASSLAAEGSLHWYRGNLHTHSHWSDGNDYLEMIALWYDEHDYDFLVFTDHNVLANRERWVAVDKTKGGRTAYDKLKARFPDWVEQRQREGQLEVRLRTFDEVSEELARPGEFLLIQGEEISDHFGRLPVHLNASNLEEVVSPRGGDSVLEVMQNNVDAVIAQRERTGRPILVHLNHPNFGHAITAEELMRVVGENFFEVYNGHPTVYNAGDHVHASTDRIWDIVLTFRVAELGLPLMYGLANDDGHEYHNIPSRGSNPGRGWVYVLAAELTPAALIDALERGRFYASSGVRLREVESSSRGLSVEVEAEEGVEYTIEFIGTRQGFDDSSEDVLDEEENVLHTTRRYSEEVGAVFKTVQGPAAAYEFEGNELYVRARVTSTKPHPNPSEPGEFERAWCQPVLGPAAPLAAEAPSGSR